MHLFLENVQTRIRNLIFYNKYLGTYLHIHEFIHESYPCSFLFLRIQEIFVVILNLKSCWLILMQAIQSHGK